MSTQLNIQAHAEMLPMEASGLVGGLHVLLVMPDGKDSLSIRLKSSATPFPALAPGDRCFVTLSIVKISVAEVPDELPGLSKLSGLIKGES